MKKILNVILICTILFSCFIPLFQYKSVKANDNFVYGIVDFKRNGSSIVYYTDVATGREGYLDPNSAADGAFLGYDAQGRIKFKVAGVTGVLKDNNTVWIKNMYPEETPTYVSYYKKVGGIFKHYINIDTTRYSGYSTWNIGTEDVGLAENVIYYSYDGHYFYKDFKVMVNDYLNGTYANSVNPSKPFYNYYQYLSNRSISSHSLDNMKNYIESMYSSKVLSWVDTNVDYIHDNTKQSQLYGEQLAFQLYQNEFGVNAYLTFGVAMNESAGGRSSFAVNRNNLFGHQAYDTDPGANASNYVSPAQSIKSHDKNYISQGYLDPCDGTNLYSSTYRDSCKNAGRYFGSHLGDKGSGINVKYASDPYWGEKASSYYYRADAQNGMKDYKKYTIGIKTNNNSYGVYKEASTGSTLLYKTTQSVNYPYLILETVNGEYVSGSNVWYKIQADTTLNDARTSITQDVGTYNYNHNYAYIHSSAVQYINWATQSSKNRYMITFDPNGGTWQMDRTTGIKRVTTEQYATPTIDTPVKDGDTFLGWSEQISAATEDKTYVAQWKSSANYQITFQADGGTFNDGSSTKKISASKGTMPSAETPTRDGYNFLGWSPNVTAVTGDATYTALWKKINTYTAIFDANGGAFSDGKTTQSQTLREGQTPTIPTSPTRSGYEFVGWNKTVGAMTENTSYLAIWKRVVTYDITFDANGGIFQGGKSTKIVTTVEGKVPSIETPTRDGYIFKGWTPTLEVATSERTYLATWQKGTIEDLLVKKDGTFFMNYMKQDDHKIVLQGYQTITGINNDLNTEIDYQILYENIDTGEVTSGKITRITDKNKIPKPVYSPDGKDYTYSWFQAEIDVDNLEQGNYKMYLLANTDKYYSKSIISNKTYNEQVTSIKGERQSAIISNNYDTSTSFVELKVREKLLANKNGSYIYNQYDKYRTFEFNTTSKLHLRGNSYAYGMDLASNLKVSRSIIFENQNTYETYTKSLGTIQNGDYTVVLPVADNFNKTQAWYDQAIDVSDIPKGTYTVYITTTSNITDIAEFTEKIGRSLDAVKATINGKTYQFTINKARGNRIEMIVK